MADVHSRDADGLGIGVQVELGGLNSAPQYNGTKGEIVAWDEKNSRWNVKLEFDGSTKALKNHALKILSDPQSGGGGAP